jgi:hypothetical protein
MATLGGPDIIEDGLVLALDAANTKSYPGSGTVWNDLSGNDNTGTLTNGPTFDSGNQGSIDFDGSNDYIDLPNDVGYTSSGVSVFCWYKVDGTPPGNYHILCGGQQLELSINTSYTYIRNGIYTTSGRFVQNDGNVSLNDGNYHYYGLTYDGSTKRSYIDGVQVGTQSITGTLTTSFSNRRLGRFGGDTSYYAHGLMGSYNIYNRALTASEVLQNYNATKGRFGL